jgi:hypothetical protein
MKKAFIIASLVSSVGYVAQTFPSDVYRLINASLLCKNLGFMDDAIDNSKLSVEFSNNVREDKELFKAKSYIAQGLAYEEIPLAQNAAKDAFNNALKEYTALNTSKGSNGLGIDAQVAINSLTHLRVKNANVNMICDSVVELKADNAATIDPNGENEGGILKSEAGNKSKTFLRNPEFSKQDSLACSGISHMNSNAIGEADKCFTAYIANNLKGGKKTSKKNENAVLFALNNVNKIKLSTSDYFQQLENSFHLNAGTSNKLDAILKDAKASQGYMTSLNILRENLSEEKEIATYNQHLDKCIAIPGINAEALARLYILKGLSDRKEKNLESAIANFKKGFDVFVHNKVHSVERTYLLEELEFLYKKTGKSKKVVTPIIDVHTGERYDHINYLPSPFPTGGEEVYVGIEIGSSGIKLSLISIEKFENPDRYEYQEIQAPKAIELNVTSFEGQINRLVIQYVKDFYDIAVKEYKVPNDRILIAFSSGVNDAAQAKNRVMELEDIRNNILEQTNVEPEILTISQEAKYTHLGVLPSKRRTEITSIDIGGQNTKGGYFYGGTDYKWGAFTFEYGTKSLVDKVTDGGKNNYNLNDLSVRLKEMMNTQTQYLREEMSDIMKEDERVLFSGGISWVIARVMRPNKIMKSDFIDDITLSDIRLFKTSVAKIGLSGFMEQQLRTVSTLSEEEKTKLVKEYEEIKSKKFTNERCISGATIVESMMEELDRGRKMPHNYTFGVHTIVGWLTGKMVSCSEGNCR